MRIAGIDVSTKTGFVCLDGDTVVDRCLVSFQDRKGFLRLQSIANSIRSLLLEHRPDRVVIEGYNYRNKHTLVILVEIGTLVRQIIYNEGMECWLVPPTTLKLYVSGKGNASKDEMASAVKKRWGFVSISDDIVDAYGLARLGQVIYSEKVKSLKGLERWM